MANYLIHRIEFISNNTFGEFVAGVALIAAARAVSSHLSKASKPLTSSSGISSSATRSSSNFSNSSNQNSSSVTFQLKSEDIWGSLNTFTRNNIYTNATSG